jgi:hypothetical protein
VKKLAISLLLFALPVGLAGAASVNGEYEGNPIVNVTSNGQSLKTDDVPAVIYNGRTVVPIAMLRQLGANVTWNAASYSVNVSLPFSSAPTTVQQDAGKQEQELLLKTYQWLKDTDTAIWMFTQQLQLYYDVLDNPAGYSQQLDEDYRLLLNRYQESLQMALKVSEQVKQYRDIRSIIDSEAKAMDQASQVKNFLQQKMSGVSITDFENIYRISFMNLTRAAQQNLNHTNDILHQLQAADFPVQAPKVSN